MDDVKHFEATLERLPGDLGWVVARVPFDPREAWPQMVRRRVVVELAGERFRTSFFAEREGTGHFVLINKKMQLAARVGEGGVEQCWVLRHHAERIAQAVQRHFSDILTVYANGSAGNIVVAVK